MTLEENTRSFILYADSVITQAVMTVAELIYMLLCSIIVAFVRPTLAVAGVFSDRAKYQHYRYKHIPQHSAGSFDW